MKYITIFLLYFLIINSCVLKKEDNKSTLPPWHLGIQLWTFHLYPFITAIEKADSCEIKNIEAYSGQLIGGAYSDSFNVNLSDKSKIFIKTFLDKKKMKLQYWGVLNPSGKKEWNKIFEFAKQMGIKVLVAEPLKEDLDYADSLAGIYNMKIAIHNHPKPAPYWEPKLIIEAMYNHPNIYACADIGHWERSGLDPIECLKKLNGKIVDVHLKDVKEFNKIDADNMILGKGIINLNGIFEELKNQKFNGQITIEHEQDWLNNVPEVKENVEWYRNEMNKLFSSNNR